MAYMVSKGQLDLVDHGLANTNAIATIKSEVDGSGEGSLFYSGYSIEDLADRSNFEEVCFLLLNDRLPSAGELDEFRKELSNDRKISSRTLDVIRIVKEDNPMAVIRTAVSSISSDECGREMSQESDMKRSISLIAKFPTIISAYEMIRKGLDPVGPDKSMDTAENFLYMMSGKRPRKEDAELLDALLVIMADHGMNASTFAARLVASTESGIYSAITAAIGALKGPLHGGANEEAVKMMEMLDSRFKNSDDLGKDVEQWVLGQLEEKKKIMGIGHRVYKGGDPRARILSKKIKEILGNDYRPYVIAGRIEEVMKREKGLSANVDLYSGILYSKIGLPEHLFTPLFAMSRIAGWTAHVLEQRANNKLLRPNSVYINEVRPLGQKYAEIGKRK